VAKGKLEAKRAFSCNGRGVASFDRRAAAAAAETAAAAVVDH